MSDIALPLSRVFQLAYVTRDLAAAQAMFEQTHGISGFTPIPAHGLALHIPAGATVSLDVAVAWSGQWMIELIQPISGMTDVHEAPLTKSDLAVFHHVAAIIPGDRSDWDSFRATLDDSRIAIEGGREQMRFVYLDERDTLGHHVEYVWMSGAFAEANPIWRPALAIAG